MDNREPIDLFITTYLRQAYTEKTLQYLEERTKYPYRLFIINNGGNDEVLDAYKDKIFLRVDVTPNSGVHNAWNLSLAMAESNYFITSDNDIYLPDLRNRMLAHNSMGTDLINQHTTLTDQPCWLERMVKFMDERPDYGAISLHPHVLIGDVSFNLNDPEDVKEVGHCGAVMRIMRTEAVRKTLGWDHVIKSGRNHEELTICSRLKTAGYKIGRTTRIRAYHPFKSDIPGSTWGYPPEFPPELQGHRPEIAEYVKAFDKPEAYDNQTWLPL